MSKFFTDGRIKATDKMVYKDGELYRVCNGKMEKLPTKKRNESGECDSPMKIIERVKCTDDTLYYVQNGVRRAWLNSATTMFAVENGRVTGASLVRRTGAQPYIRVSGGTLTDNKVAFPAGIYIKFIGCKGRPHRECWRETRLLDCAFTHCENGKGGLFVSCIFEFTDISCYVVRTVSTGKDRQIVLMTDEKLRDYVKAGLVRNAKLVSGKGLLVSDDVDENGLPWHSVKREQFAGPHTDMERLLKAKHGAGVSIHESFIG